MMTGRAIFCETTVWPSRTSMMQECGWILLALRAGTLRLLHAILALAPDALVLAHSLLAAILAHAPPAPVLAEE